MISLSNSKQIFLPKIIVFHPASITNVLTFPKRYYVWILVVRLYERMVGAVHSFIRFRHLHGGWNKIYFIAWILFYYKDCFFICTGILTTFNFRETYYIIIMEKKDMKDRICRFWLKCWDKSKNVTLELISIYVNYSLISLSKKKAHCMSVAYECCGFDFYSETSSTRRWIPQYNKLCLEKRKEGFEVFYH